MFHVHAKQKLLQNKVLYLTCVEYLAVTMSMEDDVFLLQSILN
jgi:hypothetical protein